MSRYGWAIITWTLALLAVGIWCYNLGSITYIKVSAQTCKENSYMRFIITGYYANGDQYGEATNDLAELSWLLSDIERFDTERTPSDKRVLANTIKIETEED